MILTRTARLNLGRLLLAFIAALCLFLFPGQAKANVDCAVNSQGITFGSGSTATGTVSYTCTSWSPTTENFSLCLGMGNPSWPGTAAQPQMLNGGNTLNFNLYTNASTTNVWTISTPITTSISIPSSGNGSGVNVSGSFSFYGRIPSGQGAPAGSYSAAFYNTVLGILSGGTCQSSASANGFSGRQFTLNVSANVSNNCTVSATGPADLGSVLASASNLTGSTTINVSCPSGTAFTIGLAPSNGNTAGTGVLTGTGSNTDKPPYQLRSISGSGPIWGNTATTTNVGNGVAGTGTGSTQSFRVYVLIPSANFVPDTYTDTVTVHLNF